MTPEMFDELVTHSVTLRATIMQHGGMATKSVIEDVLMLMYPGLNREQAHMIQNHVEHRNLDRSGRTPAELKRYAPYLKQVNVNWVWCESDPLAALDEPANTDALPPSSTPDEVGQ